ncbi:MAG: hypothetical protein RR623_05030 [Bacilli bacterium]
MENYDQEVVRLGLQFGRGLVETLSTFITSYKSFVGTKGDRSVKSFQKEFQGQKFLQRDKFVAQSTKKTGESSFKEMKLCEKDLKTFDKLCRDYGVDYLYEKKPNIDIQAIINKNKNNLNTFEEIIIKKWTEVDANGKVIETEDDAKITFRIKDIEKMDYVTEDLLTKKNKLQERITNAKNNKTQNTNENVLAKDITKNINKER